VPQEHFHRWRELSGDEASYQTLPVRRHLDQTGAAAVVRSALRFCGLQSQSSTRGPRNLLIHADVI
jgi:hypothetical protein